MNALAQLIATAVFHFMMVSSPPWTGAVARADGPLRAAPLASMSFLGKYTFIRRRQVKTPVRSSVWVRIWIGRFGDSVAAGSEGREDGVEIGEVDGAVVVGVAVGGGLS